MSEIPSGRDRVEIMSELPPPPELARSLPDEPRWVDLRGLLLSGRCAVYTGDDPEAGLIARSWDFPFAAMAGKPPAATIRRVVEDAIKADEFKAGSGTSSGEWHLLIPASSVKEVGEALRGWRWRGVTIHRFDREVPAAAPAAPEGAEVRLAPQGTASENLDLTHLPRGLRDELSIEYIATRPMAAAFVGGRPVAFCYAPYVTESLWDVAVDTVQPFRRRGLAAACFEALAWHMGRGGRRPVWGALDGNVASMRMAQRMGFRSDIKLVSFVRPSSQSD